MLVFYEPIHFGVTTDRTFQWTTYQTSYPNNMSFVDSRLSLSTVNFGRAPRQRSAVNLTNVQRSAESAFVPKPLSGLPCNWLWVINNIEWKIYVVILTKTLSVRRRYVAWKGLVGFSQLHFDLISSCTLAGEWLRTSTSKLWSSMWSTTSITTCHV